MPLELKKTPPTKLRSLGLDEKWLQDRIDEDPSLLGIGDLHVIRRERRQPSGGRIDFLLYDPDSETRYEVEIMLGTLNESHIIRTIEYWDIERQRYPSYDHRAVIVAEEITSRFFNVIRLLNRAIPMIALQLSAFAFGDRCRSSFHQSAGCLRGSRGRWGWRAGRPSLLGEEGESKFNGDSGSSCFHGANGRRSAACDVE